MIPLSTWGEGIVAAATGDVVKMQRLLDGHMDDGSGIDLRTFRTSIDDVHFIFDQRDRAPRAHAHCSVLAWTHQRM